MLGAQNCCFQLLSPVVRRVVRDVVRCPVADPAKRFVLFSPHGRSISIIQAHSDWLRQRLIVDERCREAAVECASAPREAPGPVRA